MSYLPTPSIDILEQYLTYDSFTGNLAVNDWVLNKYPKFRFTYTATKGKIKGQLMLNLFGVRYAVKRICFKMAKGRDARKPIKHLNGDNLDFAGDNLQECGGKPHTFKKDYDDHEKALLYSTEGESAKAMIIKHGLRSTLSGLYQAQSGLQALMRAGDCEELISDLGATVDQLEALKDEIILMMSAE